MIDLDSQCNATFTFLDQSLIKTTLADVLVGYQERPSLIDAIYETHIEGLERISIERKGRSECRGRACACPRVAPVERAGTSPAPTILSSAVHSFATRSRSIKAGYHNVSPA